MGITVVAADETYRFGISIRGLGMIRQMAGLLAFGVELAALWSFCEWAFHLPLSMPMRVAAAIAAPLAIAVVWGLFLSPKARWHLPVAIEAAGKFIVFAAAAGLAWMIGQVHFAGALAVLAGASLAVEYLAGVKAVNRRPADM